MLEEKNGTGAGKVTKADLESEAAISREGQSVPFARPYLWSCCHDSEVLSGELRPNGDQAPSFSSDLAPTDFLLYAKIKTVVKEEEFKTPSVSTIT